MSHSVFTQKERNIITLVLLLLLGVVIAYAVRGIIGALLGTMVMYTIFRPLNSWLVERLKWRRPLAAVFIIIISFLIIVLPFLGIGTMLTNKIVELVKNPEWIKNTVNTINEYAGDKLGKPDLLREQLEKSASYLGGLLTSLLSGAAGLFLDITVMYFLLYFMFINFRGFERGLLRYSPFRIENAIKFGHELRNITYSNVIGQTFIALVQGGALALGFWIFGFDDPIFWGVICAILAFVPLLGPPLVFVPAAVYAFTQGDNFAAIGLLIYGFVVVINIDNVLRLIIAKKVGDIHPIITVVGVIIGIPLFGVMGLVYGPLLLSYFLITVRIYETNKKQRPLNAEELIPPKQP
ncbi:AI-2E family transporter [Parapedobacter indicus]|uniref:Predicted PurR-regulated permease PerM n=1 Tax=Parapedobacter indicus TaxID=1477437 RepID=A0A1I3U2G0_9SPHI|nr:AI-2E family transporter [Parapedobacter indicus]PPK99469.1 putative PurR-regulated permease PerM [Parapedobacter indicus]SFJ75957.1 Predicted PurR-regulated permease PerM [Parapedobacter indicus]